MLWNLSIAVSAGTLPVNLTVKALSCGIQPNVLAKEDPAPEELLSKIPFSCLINLFWVLDAVTGLLACRASKLFSAEG